MGLTSALNTSLNGLALNETAIDVLGNNIANAGTNGFKSSSVRFATQLSRTLSIGSRPTESRTVPDPDNPGQTIVAGLGGTNPLQIGLGASVSSISRDFSQGSISNSTSPSDLAIQGSGFFVLNGPNGQVYSRNGNFSLNAASQLINDQGHFVQGYGIDDNFELVTTALSPLSIPLGDLNIAQRTQNARLSGALNPSGSLSTIGAQLTSETMFDGAAAVSTLADEFTELLDIENATGSSLFAMNQVLTFTPKKGGRTLEPISLTVTAGTTLAQLRDFMDQTIGIQSAGVPANTNGAPGVSIVNGELVIIGNTGEVNDIDISAGDLRDEDGNVIDLSFLKSDDAVGESASTEFIVYDSLGQPVRLRVTATLESRGTDETTWRYYFESNDDSRDDIALATGTFEFNNEGQLSGDPFRSVMLQRENVAAISPMQIEFDFSDVTGISAGDSGLNLVEQDGAPPGTLQSFVISEEGIVNGIFDNGIIRPLGQVVLARFANNNGLIEDGNTTFKEGVSSGIATIVTPGTFGVGTLRSGAIELSNTDIGKSLVDLIVASTNYKGNARVISSVQQLVDELLVLGR
ncbi:MAG: flagellar hook-basal body complex protein [Planctomycetaceae bacterium]|nr:flagellar hook-basal body complex protein [Planctomycetaceae bacterium]